MRALRHQVELCHIDDIAKHPPGTSRRYKVAFAFVGARHIVPEGYVSPCPQTRIAFEILGKEIIVYRLFLRNNAHLWPFSSSNPHLWGYHKGNFPIERSSRNLFGLAGDCVYKHTEGSAVAVPFTYPQFPGTTRC